MKFVYDRPFQESIIRFVLQDPDGGRVLKFLEPEYFTYNDLFLLFRIAKGFWENQQSQISYDFLVEGVNQAFNDGEIEELFSLEEKQEFIESLKGYFETPVKNPKALLDEILNFRSYVEVQDLMERVDLTDFSQYARFAEGVLRAIKLKDQFKEEKFGGFLIKDLLERQFQRRHNPSVVPTPFLQLNRLTNAGGYAKGSLMVLVDKAKHLKTFNLINIARGYLRMKKKVLIIDLENGEMELFDRLEESIGKITKQELLSGKYDRRIQKILRRYRRLGGEVYIRRVPNLATANDIKLIMEDLQRDFNITFDVLIVDYVGLLGSQKTTNSDFNRISEAVLELLNLGFEFNLDCIWTAMHVQREAGVRSTTRYKDSDISKSIDIPRHAQVVLGIQRSPEEEAAGLMRWEVISQRDGVPDGRVYFEVDVARQYSRELTKAELQALNEFYQSGEHIEDED